MMRMFLLGGLALTLVCATAAGPVNAGAAEDAAALKATADAVARIRDDVADLKKRMVRIQDYIKSIKKRIIFMKMPPYTRHGDNSFTVISGDEVEAGEADGITKYGSELCFLMRRKMNFVYTDLFGRIAFKGAPPNKKRQMVDHTRKPFVGAIGKNFDNRRVKVLGFICSTNFIPRK